MHADFELEPDGTARPAKGFGPEQTIKRGGARPGAGAKPAGYVPPPEKVEFDKEKARNEKAKADLNELDYKIKSGEYVPRAAVQQASATLLATISQTLRSLPDTLERRLNLSPEVAEMIGVEVDAILDGLGEDLRILAGDDE